MNKRHRHEAGKILLDKNLKVLLVNRKAIEFFGINKHKVVGNNILIYFPYNIRKNILPKLQGILCKKQVCKQQEYKFILNFIDFKTQKTKITLRTVFQKKRKEIKGIIVTLHIQKELNNRETRILLSKTINNLSHELRAPLFNIRSFLETLYEYDRLLSNNQRLEFIEIATNETNRLNKLVNDILDFASLENNNHFQGQPSKFLLKNIVQQILQLNQLPAINKKIFLTKTLKINELNIVADYDSILRILSNLLDNSIKFTYPKGIINIETKVIKSISINEKNKKNIARISITDTGIGISKKDIYDIFNRFARVSKSENNINGSGLGLPIVKEILARDNQLLNLLSSPGKGTKSSFNTVI